MTDKEREEFAEVIGKGLASGSKISAEDLQNENTISYKMGEIMEMDADFVTLLNFVDWYSPTKEVNEKLTKMLRHIAGQTYQNQTKVAELEKENAEMKIQLYAFDEEQEKLRKENAELKEQCSILADCNTCTSTCKTENIEMKKQLTKAKELLKWALHSDPEHDEDLDQKWEEAEQFLSEVEK